MPDRRAAAAQPLPFSETQRNVLIVDDDAASRRLLAVTLRNFGFDVRTAANGEEALQMIGQSPPDVVVLDFEMPGLDGATICGRLRDDPGPSIREIPVIMLTAHSGEQDEIRCL